MTTTTDFEEFIGTCDLNPYELSDLYSLAETMNPNCQSTFELLDAQNSSENKIIFSKPNELGLLLTPPARKYFLLWIVANKTPGSDPNFESTLEREAEKDPDLRTFLNNRNRNK